MYLKHCLLCLHYNPVCNINYPANTVAMTLLKAIKAKISISDLHPTLPIFSRTQTKTQCQAFVAGEGQAPTISRVT